jgi:hypothetical protein
MKLLIPSYGSKCLSVMALMLLTLYANKVLLTYSMEQSPS